MGRGGESDGLRFFGDVEAHVNLLMSLSKAFGEDSAEVKAYIEQQQKVAAAMNESALLETVGHGREPKVGATAYEQFMLLVQDERELAAKAGDPIAEADAIERAARKNPRLYNQYTRESAQRV